MYRCDFAWSFKILCKNVCCKLQFVFIILTVNISAHFRTTQSLYQENLSGSMFSIALKTYEISNERRPVTFRNHLRPYSRLCNRPGRGFPFQFFTQSTPSMPQSWLVPPLAPNPGNVTEFKLNIFIFIIKIVHKVHTIRINGINAV